MLPKCLIRSLARSPRIFDWLRDLLEDDFRAPKERVRTFSSETGRALLDCGCGTGVFASCVSPRRYVGIDLSETYVDAARTRCPEHRFEVMNAMDLQFGDATFDRAIIMGVLHHLSDAQVLRVLAEVRRVLIPGGELLVCEDVPSLSRLNWIGHLAHRLDLGAHIRRPEHYARLIRQLFLVDRIEPMRSGFMDYAVLSCRTQATQSPRPRKPQQLAVLTR